jgi:purine-cytosine permease-like protein
VLVFLPAAFMVLLTGVVGLYVSGAVYLATYMRWIGRHSWALILVLSIGIPVVTFLIFEVWFLVPLPKGPLETRLGY